MASRCVPRVRGDEPHINAFLGDFEAQARAWSEETGRPAEDWFGEHIADLRVGEPDAKAIRFHEGGESGGTRAEEISARLESMQSQSENALPLHVVQSMAELPEHIRRHAASRGISAVDAVTDGDGVWLVADHIRSPEQAAGLWMHEQGLHHGLRGTFGSVERLNGFLDQVYDHLGADQLEGLRRQYGLDFADAAHRREAAEEILARIAEKIEFGAALDETERTVWQKLVEAVRQFLREHGFEVELRDEYLVATVKDAVRWTVDGKPGRRTPGNRVPGRMLMVKDDPGLRVRVREGLGATAETFEDRAKLREFLNGIEPGKLLALKERRYKEYEALLNRMIEKMFPEGAGLTFRTRDGVFDMEHLIKDHGRIKYVHSLPKTLRSPDIEVEFREGDARKAYLIKKYFDPKVQKDIWDLIVMHEAELTTKFARKGAKARKYLEGEILGAGQEASPAALSTGDTGSAPTRLTSLKESVPSGDDDGNPRFAVGREEYNGAVEFLPDGRAAVTLAPDADLEAATGELGRILRERFAERPPLRRDFTPVHRDDTPSWTEEPEGVAEREYEREAEEVAALHAEGLLSENDMLDLRAADEGEARAAKWGEALAEAARCLTEAV